MARILKEPIFWVKPEQLKRTAGMTKQLCDTYGVRRRTLEYQVATVKSREVEYLSGDWDINQTLFADHPFLQTLEVYESGGDVKAVHEYQIAVKRFSPAKAEALFGKWIRIYEDMKINGWRQSDDRDPWNEYVLAAVGRSGELLFYQGIHRLSMALKLGIPSIPVKVGFRHKEWYDFRETVKGYAKAHRGLIYSPINHPDFITFNTGWTEYRGNLISQHISKESKTVLDIGAHWGYFSELLARKGKDCTAIEKAPSMYRFLDKISKFPDKPGFNAVNMGINEFLSGHNQYFDCVIALNIFHHFLKNKEGWANLVKVAESLHTNEIFFQMANDKTLGKFGKGYKKTADVLQLLVDKTGLRNVSQIGTENNRAIYHIKEGKRL